jgi:hypothetical protein
MLYLSFHIRVEVANALGIQIYGSLKKRVADYGDVVKSLVKLLNEIKN